MSPDTSLVGNVHGHLSCLRSESPEFSISCFVLSLTYSLACVYIFTHLSIFTFLWSCPFINFIHDYSLADSRGGPSEYVVLEDNR